MNSSKWCKRPLFLCAVLLVVSVIGVLFIAGCGGGNGGTGGGSTIQPTGRIDGHIYLAGASEPAAGATVRIQGLMRQATTDANGAFMLEGVPVGPQRLVVMHAGHQMQEIPVMVEEGQTAHVQNVELIAASRKWTVLVFLNADNDLEDFGIEDVNEMEAVPDSDQVTVAVQMDRSPGFDTSNGNWTGTRRFVVKHDNDPQVINSPVLQEMGEVDMGRADTFRNFLAWGQQNYPAEHYMVVIWNHGSGWRSRSEGSALTRGVSFDDTSGTFIKTQELPQALAAPAPLDIISFDASLMQMLEIAYQMRDTGEYIVGSEESPPGAGYPYHTWLGPLVANPSMTARELAVTMARETLNYYGTSSDITHSVLAVGELEGLAAAVDAFARALIPVASSHGAQLAAARSEAEAYKYSEYKDLYDYARLVTAKVGDAKVRSAADGVMAAVHRAVIAEYHGSWNAGSHGVSIYIPTQTAYVRYGGEYPLLDFGQRTMWDEWLGKQAQ
ncbi:MAG: clostripain-related cysteine peptidase [Armatimonadota bacterium]